MNYGRYLVLPEYRRKGIMCNIEKLLLEEAVQQKNEYAIATAHPSNVASIKTLEKVGFILKKSNILLENYIRNIYVKILN